jgi:hypothetical protein
MPIFEIKHIDGIGEAYLDGVKIAEMNLPTGHIPIVIRPNAFNDEITKTRC